MMEDELVKIWQSSPNQERVKFEKSRLMLDVQAKVDRLDKLIKYRDLREAIGAAIVIPAFAFIAFRTPFTLSRIAAVLIVLYVIFAIIHMLKVRKKKPGAVTATYLDYLHKTREYIEAQKHLTDTVLYWYLLPGYVGLTLFTLGSGRIPYILKMQVFGIVFGVVAYYMNKRVVKKTYVPRLEKIDELIKRMEEQQ